MVNDDARREGAGGWELRLRWLDVVFFCEWIKVKMLVRWEK